MMQTKTIFFQYLLITIDELLTDIKYSFYLFFIIQIWLFRI